MNRDDASCFLPSLLVTRQPQAQTSLLRLSQEESVDEMEGRTEEERQLLENEMRDLEDAVVGLEQDYRLVDRLGEGASSYHLRLMLLLTRESSRYLLLCLQGH